MIRTGIIGADSRHAGELIRILVNHPEIEMVGAVAPRLAGHRINSHHSGLVGDTNLCFSDTIDLRKADVLFLVETPIEELPVSSLPEELKIIAMPGMKDIGFPTGAEDIEFVPALSEIFRKPLVRGARGAMVLRPAEAVALIALFPLALHLLLNDTLSMKVIVASEISGADCEATILTVEKILKEVQLSFNGIAGMQCIPSEDERAVRFEAEMNCMISLEEIEKIYHDVYDDHNFTFMVRRPLKVEEVKGTQKCLIRLSKPSDSTLKIEAVADAILRGGAGDAVHAMNLLFGLFEKIGLNFRAPYAFFNNAKR